MKIRTIMLLALSTGTLAACDAATDIAGDAIRAEARNALITQCQEASEGAGIAAVRVAAVCECSADAFMSDGSFTLSDIDPARLEEIVNTCVVQTDATSAE